MNSEGKVMDFVPRRSQLFVDSDGVFGDFDGHVKRLFGKSPSELKNDTLMWELIGQDPEGFWSSLPLKHGAWEFWEFVKPLNPIVLTGCSKHHYEIAANHKRLWWKDQFDHEHVITCLSRDKGLHIQNPGDVLVDDMVKNLKRWEKAGGVGVHYRNAEDAISRLRSLMGIIVEAT